MLQELRLCWEAMSPDDIELQKNDRSVSKGRNGYVCAPMGSGVLEALAGEAITNCNESLHSPGLFGRHIPAATLRERLPKALAVAPKAYEKKKPEEIEQAMESLAGFVTMAEELESFGIHTLICPFISP